MFWFLLSYLNHLYSGRYGDLLYKDRQFEFIPKLFLQSSYVSKRTEKKLSIRHSFLSQNCVILTRLLIFHLTRIRAI